MKITAQQALQYTCDDGHCDDGDDNDDVDDDDVVCDVDDGAPLHQEHQPWIQD